MIKISRCLLFAISPVCGGPSWSPAAQYSAQAHYGSPRRRLWWWRPWASWRRAAGAQWRGGCSCWQLSLHRREREPLTGGCSSLGSIPRDSPLRWQWSKLHCWVAKNHISDRYSLGELFSSSQPLPWSQSSGPPFSLDNYLKPLYPITPQMGSKEQRTWGLSLRIPETNEITERHLTFEPQIRRQYKVDILLLKFLCRLSDDVK